MISWLDRPCHPSSYHSKSVRILGWVQGGDVGAINEQNIELLLEAGSSQLEPQPRSGLKLSTTAASGRPHLSELRLIPAEQARSEISDFYPPAGALVLDALLDTSAILPSIGEGTKTFRLTLCVRSSEQICISNSVLFELYPRERWGDALGGFTYPTNFPLSSDFLAVRGWAGRKGDVISSVDLLLCGEHAARCECGLWSPEIFVSLPDVAGKHSCFAGTIARQQFVGRLEAAQRSRAGCSLQANVLFESGEALLLDAAPLFWAPGNFRSLLESGCGEIEDVRLEEDGRLRLSGWFIGAKGASADFELHSPLRSISVCGNSNFEIEFERLERQDIANRFLPCAAGSDYGFNVRFNPFVLGRVPGELDLLACVEGRRLRFSSADARRRVNAYVKQLSEWQGSAKRGVRKAAGLALGAASNAARILPEGRSRAEQQAKSKRVLFAAHNLSDTEGAPAVLFDVVSKLQVSDPGTEVMVVSSRDGALRTKLERLGVEVRIIEDSSMVAQTWSRYHRAQEAFQLLLRDFKPAVVLANTLDCFWAVDGARRCSLRSVWTIHECINPLEAYPETDPRIRMQFCDILSGASELVFVSHASANIYRDIARTAAIHVIPNGIDLRLVDQSRGSLDKAAARKRLGIEQNVRVVSIIGTTTKRKGQDVFIKEMAKLKYESEESLKLLIVGARRGEFLDALKIQARELGLESCLQFVEETADVVPYYLASDVVVVASRVESSPLVPLEAFAYEIPLVSTTAYGLSEQIRNEENALAFDLDAEGSLSDAVARVLRDKTLRERIVREARKDVEQRFIHDAALAQHVSILSQP